MNSNSTCFKWNIYFAVNWNDSVETIKMFDQVESDEEFEHFLSSLPEAVMDGSKPLPNEIGHILSVRFHLLVSQLMRTMLKSLITPALTDKKCKLMPSR